MFKQYVSWTQLKNLPNATWAYREEAKEYIICRFDDFIHYETGLKKSNYNVADTETKDFYDNYKPGIDNGTLPSSLIMRDADGFPLGHKQNVNRTNYFTSVDDDTGVSDGSNELKFNMTTSDSSKSVSMVFSEDVWVMDAIIQFVNAPFGSAFDIEIYHPTGPTLVGSFGKDCHLLGSGLFHLTPTKSAKVDQGLILKVTVHNGDTAADFQVVAIMMVDRVDTI